MIASSITGGNVRIYLEDKADAVARDPKFKQSMDIIGLILFIISCI